MSPYLTDGASNQICIVFCLLDHEKNINRRQTTFDAQRLTPTAIGHPRDPNDLEITLYIIYIIKESNVSSFDNITVRI